MTNGELQMILQSDKTYTLDEIKEIINQLRLDAYDEIYKLYDCPSKDWDAKMYRTEKWYQGEENAFYIVLKLLDKVI